VKFITVLILSLVLLNGCNIRPTYTDDICFGCVTFCAEGIKYLCAGNGVTVMYNTDGTIKKCGDK